VIDATYEGDAYASANTEYRLGRESRDQWGEPHARVVYFDYQNKYFLAGTTGSSDRRLPAYTYRLCLTTDPENSCSLTEPPVDYDATNDMAYFDDLRLSRSRSTQRAETLCGEVGSQMLSETVELVVPKSIPKTRTDCAGSFVDFPPINPSLFMAHCSLRNPQKIVVVRSVSRPSRIKICSVRSVIAFSRCPFGRFVRSPAAFRATSHDFRDSQRCTSNRLRNIRKLVRDASG